ncbi:MAG: adenylate cyclase regulatory domain-containing protein [Acidimicrobiales bacterium]
MDDVEDPTRAALVDRCRELGMTPDEINEAGDDLVEVAVRRAYGVGQEDLTLDQVVERSGVDRGRAEQIFRASGVMGNDLDEPIFSDQDVETVKVFSAAEELLGTEAVLQMIRVAGASMVRIGDAAISAFLTNMAAPAMREDESGLTLLEANIATAALIPPFGQTLTQILLRYLRDAFRPMSDEFIAGELGVDVDTVELAIGFADLVGSTTLAANRSLAELSVALDGFERTATEVVAAGGGRVVKFIGDEVMFRAPDPDSACAIALELAGRVRDDPDLPPLRAGVAFGDVLSRDGDFYGPTVNLAARITKLSPLHGVVTTAATAQALAPDHPFSITALGAIEMKGISEPVELVMVDRA